MTDKAVQDSSNGAPIPWVARTTLAIPAKPAEGAPHLQAVTPLPQNPEGLAAAGMSRDYGSALDLIREASAAIAIKEERASELEAQLQQVTAAANEEIRQLKARLEASERRAQKSDERARVAELRATEAEAWLVRLHDAILDGFGHRRALAPETTLVERSP
jgi:small-conductance mechanosensitive channel